MNNQVYKCERCGKLYTLSDFEKHREAINYNLSKTSPNFCREDRVVGLCDECSIALNDFMDREKKEAPKLEEKGEASLEYGTLIAEALAKQLVKQILEGGLAE